MFAFLGIRGMIAAGMGLALIVCLGLLKLEHNAKLKARAERDTAQLAASISQQQILLYQEREAIKDQAGKKRGKINDWQRKSDVDSLVDDFNTPGDGVRRKVPANPQGGSRRPTRAFAYQESSAIVRS